MCDHVLHGVTWHLSSEHLAQLQCQECSPWSHQWWLISTARWQNSEQPWAAGMGTLHSLHPASSSHHTFLPHWPGKHNWCCSLQQSMNSYFLNLLRSCCISLLKPPNRAEVCPWKPSLLCSSYAVCCYTFASNLLLLLIHLDWNSKLVWRRPELFIAARTKISQGMRCTSVLKTAWCVRVNDACVALWGSCSQPLGMMGVWVMTIKTWKPICLWQWKLGGVFWYSSCFCLTLIVNIATLGPGVPPKSVFQLSQEQFCGHIGASISDRV